MSPNYWPRAPLMRDRGSHAVAQRHTLGCYLPAPAMATLSMSMSIPSTPSPQKNERMETADGADGPQRTFTGAQLKTTQEVITLARAVSLIFKEW